jgi:hypothetical protein
MILATLLLLSGLSISVVAIYYSVMGLMAIFSAAAIPIAIMGVSLEIGKLVTASWVKAHWHRLPLLMKTYAVAAVAILMVITSLGIFGYLSKAHSDQTLVSGDVQAKVAIYDERIKTEKDNIEADRKQIAQMDAAVDQILSRSDDEKGASKANEIRRSQLKDRSRLQNEILASQKKIATIQDERAPFAAENRKVEAEVGPIKYIAAFVYGANPDANILERAVTWVIILIVIVFDPLAVVMLLASQMTFQWIREDKKKVVKEHTSGEMTKDTQTETSDGLVGEPLPESVPTPTEEPIVTHENDGMAIVNPEEIPNFTPHALTQEEMDALDEVSISDHDEEIIEHTSEDDVIDSTNLPEHQPSYEFIEEHSGEDDIEFVQVIAKEESPDIERPGDYVTPPEAVTVTIDGGVIPESTAPVNIVREASPARGRGIMHTHLTAQADDLPDSAKAAHSGFGNEFPINPNKGDVYLRTDYLPNRLFKFNGQKWIEVDAEQRDILAYDDLYIRHLVNEIESGRQDVDLLSDLERSQIAEYLSRHSG